MKKEERVLVHHPVQKAEARPLKEHLQAWLDKGWVVSNKSKNEGDKK